jgi:hypothetical protein
MNGKPLTSMGVANDKVDIVYSVEGQDTASREDAERLLRIQEEKARTAREEQNAFIREAEKRKYDAERRTTVSQQIRGGQIIKLEEQINWLLAQPWMNQTGLLTERMELEAASTIIDSYRRKKNPTPADERILQFAINSYERVMDVLQSLQGK